MYPFEKTSQDIGLEIMRRISSYWSVLPASCGFMTAMMCGIPVPMVTSILST
jgi:hypothetical protein